jgi:hypothetical protein
MEPPAERKLSIFIFMTEEQFFSIVPAQRFFQEWCPHISNWRHKRRKIDGNKKPIDFTEVEKQRIRQAAQTLGKELGKLKM